MWVEELKEYVCNGTLTSIQLKILLERLSGMSYEAIRTITDVNLNRPHTHTVCVPYYKAAPYNISHTKIFQWRFSL